MHNITPISEPIHIANFDAMRRELEEACNAALLWVEALEQAIKSAAVDEEENRSRQQQLGKKAGRP
jgi:hypothetical protein